MTTVDFVKTTMRPLAWALFVLQCLILLLGAFVLQELREHRPPPVVLQPPPPPVEVASLPEVGPAPDAAPTGHAWINGRQIW